MVPPETVQMLRGPPCGEVRRSFAGRERAARPRSSSSGSGAALRLLLDGAGDRCNSHNMRLALRFVYFLSPTDLRSRVSAAGFWLARTKGNTVYVSSCSPLFLVRGCVRILILSIWCAAASPFRSLRTEPPLLRACAGQSGLVTVLGPGSGVAPSGSVS